MQVVLKEIGIYWQFLFISLVVIFTDFFPSLTENYSDFTMISPSALCITCSLLSYFIFAIAKYRKKIINRLTLALSLFASVGSVAFLTKMSFVLYYYDTYRYLLPFAFIIGVGLFTMIFTQAGFVGVLSDDKRSVRIASLKLLAASVLAALFSFYTQSFTFSMLPLAIYDWRLRYVIEGGSSKPWKFKW